MRAGVLALLLMAALAGCIDPEEVPGDTETEPGLVVDADRPDPVFKDVVTGPAVGPDLNATTAAAPRLVEGEWWRIRFDNSLDNGVSEVVRVVADVNEDGYIFGMPHEGWFKEAIAFHAPAFGDVAFDLSYMTHNERFEPLRFPLEKGATWETTFATAPFTATVEEADEYTAVVRFDPPEDPDPVSSAVNALIFGDGGGMRLTFDARMHEVVKMESFIGTWEVVGHGYGFEGWVTVPRGEHTAIDYGRLGPASPDHTPLEQTLKVEGGFNRMTLMHLVVALGPGAFAVRSVTPNGTEFVTESMGEEQVTIRFYEISDPDGEWTVEDRILGPGATYSMGIAYHQYDIRLPDGQRRSDHSHPVIR